ncbi:MAG: FtsQ-type POTRA domain-containing protein [Clostridia bacterium]|nr:FtsQ-type POTRA domain-containing protein [Clostridia bacterium]
MSFRNKAKSALAVFVAIFVIMIMLAVIFAALCRVGEITVEGASFYSADEIISISNIKNGSFIFALDKTEAEELILHGCSVINDVEISVKLPKKVIIRVTEEQPAFYTLVGSTAVMFTQDLRVSEIKSADSSVDAIKVILPEITNALAGEKIQFLDSDGEYISKLLEAVMRTDYFDRITEIGAETMRNSFVIVDDRFTLFTDGVSDIDNKLYVAGVYLENESFKNAKEATLFLADPNEPIASIRN